MIERPEITQTTEQLVARIHITVPRHEIQTVMGPGITEVMSTLAAQGIAPAGPWFTHHSKMEPGVFDFDICVPIATPVAPAGRVVPDRLPATKVARAIYRGPYEGLADAWPQLDAWVAREGLRPREDLWESYVAGPESGSDPAQWATELNRPLLD
ncbi:GyrI-like domain-containing protein [Nannocystaceae bacterium ST9]